jgi:hypothetical protein
MAAPKGPELGMRQPLILRAGAGFEFEGLQKQWDPGGLPPGALQDAQNARLVGGRLVCRGGLSGVIGDALAGSVIGLFDDREDWVTPGDYGDEFGGTPTDTIWFITGYVGGGNYGLGYWDGTQVVMVEDRAGTQFLTLAQLGPGGEMYVTSGATAYHVNPPTIDLLDVGEGDLLGRGAAWDPVTGDLWFANGAGDILRFDGTSLYLMEEATGEQIIMFMAFGEELQVLTKTTLYERGDEAAWDVQYTLPALVGSSYEYAFSWFVRGSILWFTMGAYDGLTYDLHILTYDGDAITTAHTVAGASGGALARIVGEEPLYYAFYDPTASEIHIGRYSGGAFDDDYCVGDGSTYGAPTELAAHKDGYLLLATANGYLLKSGTDLSDFSSYTVVGTGLSATEGIFWFWQERSA